MSDRTKSLLAGLFLGLPLGVLLAALASAQEPPPVESGPAGAPASSGQPAPDPRPAGAASSESICLLIESAASANGLPLEFFARVIWQESRFQPDAIGPLTRSGERARGIAQFMPRTAAERGLLDPLDPIAALPKSAEFLKALRDDFGNLGLAAAAYNAGPRRVRDWLTGADALILRSKFRSRGTRDFYQVRVGADTRATADRVCARLSAAGVACLVLRNSRGTQET